MNKRILKTMLIVAGGGLILSQLAFTQTAEAQKAGLNNTCTNAFTATSLKHVLMVPIMRFPH